MCLCVFGYRGDLPERVAMTDIKNYCTTLNRYFLVKDGAGSKWPPVHKVYSVGVAPQKKNKAVECKKLIDYITLLLYC